MVGSLFGRLLQDLERRGMLKDTLEMWGGEFGPACRLPSSAGISRESGRDHNPRGFSLGARIIREIIA